MKGKEIEGNLMKKKRQRSNRRDRGVERDRLSVLPECVLLHVMKFLDTKEAVQICVLSKRWKDLWKRLTNLTFHSLDFRRLAFSRKFVSRVLSNRDGSISVLDLDIMDDGAIHPALLNRVTKYAALRNVQQMSIHVHVNIPDFEFCPLIFSCQSLTSLELSLSYYSAVIKLPKSMHLPAIKSLHLVGFTFTASENDCAEPFSTCTVLNTLVLVRCWLHNDARTLRICNSNLSCLTIIHDKINRGEAYKIALPTPNLSSVTILGCPSIQLSSICNLSFLEEVNINTLFPSLWNTNLLYNWLQVFTNVKIMTLPADILVVIQHDLANTGSMTSQTPCFVRLELLKVKRRSFTKISAAEVYRAVGCLLQNSPLARVDLIYC